MPIICHSRSSFFLFSPSLQPLKAFNSASLPDSSYSNHGIAHIGDKWNKLGAHLHISVNPFHLICIITLSISIKYQAMWAELFIFHTFSVIMGLKIQCPQCVTQHSYVDVQVLFTVGTVLKWRSNKHQSPCAPTYMCVTHCTVWSTSQKHHEEHLNFKHWRLVWLLAATNNERTSAPKAKHIYRA